ncbi:hypothetical protein TEA_002391 [Camellia sinensis var. sinensis]|uniref:Uncharacterized protein n=1 Tax=Camellia sinensis var. sinensis TaxID=542762 RepID=A0A4S4EUK9_CAMSN|nr:hypothetical protein TEA_002391 [Camellia sinensis var. sinensis]
MAVCATDTSRALSCRNSHAASNLKLISICVIFFTSVIGISSPVMLARLFHGKPVYDKAILIIKCFAAGVILSTSLVHVLPDAFDALADCQVASQHPWKDFPFSGLVTLIGVLAALLVDLTASSHVDSHGKSSTKNYTPIGGEELEAAKKKSAVELGAVEEEGGGGEGEAAAEEVVRMKQRLVSQVLEIGIIFHSVIIGVTMGMSQNQCTIRPLVAALAFHQIFEGMGLGGCIAQRLRRNRRWRRTAKKMRWRRGDEGCWGGESGVGEGNGEEDDREEEVKAQILEGHSRSEWMWEKHITKKGENGKPRLPSYGKAKERKEQERGFSFGTTAYMCFMFSVTTPIGIVLGMIIFSLTGYDDSSPNALILEGLLGSLSAGVLIYMGLVDLIALDFFHSKLMSSEYWLKKASFVALVLGSTSMSILALWA